MELGLPACRPNILCFLHTVELPVVLLEAFIVHHRYPSTAEGYSLTATFGGAYLLWYGALQVDEFNIPTN
ncbi:hypothetical protein AVEN_150206-1 [Araneus ventricosus]|uniref:Uncharacterized protein n=1 Tax=Araneus ventricosus TaxID=182803 RepID=A0A4Y2F4L3_ARAVE|nr:hypothetical protein AVEN_126591-1 [Araneus ventricosus]GBM36373.1 hypothetical protein AVEN_150206-1 [Araneus ventricosus]